MRRKLTFIALFLLAFSAVVLAQRGTVFYGGRMMIEKTGALTLTSKSGQAITLTGATAHIGASTFSSTVGVTGATTLTGGVTVGSGGTAVTKVISGTGSLNFGATAAGACDVLTITVTGAADGDTVALGIPHALANADNYQSFHAWVSATNTVSVKRCNLTNATTALSDPAAATVRATVVKF